MSAFEAHINSPNQKRNWPSALFFDFVSLSLDFVFVVLFFFCCVSRQSIWFVFIIFRAVMIWSVQNRFWSIWNVSYTTQHNDPFIIEFSCSNFIGIDLLSVHCSFFVISLSIISQSSPFFMHFHINWLNYTLWQPNKRINCLPSIIYWAWNWRRKNVSANGVDYWRRRKLWFNNEKRLKRSTIESI